MASELQISVNDDSLNLYAIIRKHSDATVWSVTNTAWEAWADGSVGDYDVALTSQDGDMYTGNFPSSISAGTRVRVHYYKRAGASPATTDLLLASRDFTWNGTSLAAGDSVTLSSTALTTLAGVKRHLRITDSAQDNLLTELINAMSARFIRLVGRDILATEYYEWVSGTGQEKVRLKNWPIIRVNRVFTGANTGLSVSYSGSAIEATVTVTTDAVRLVTMVAAGTETTSSLAFATYPTLSTLATAINAVSGWTATAQEDARAYTLHPTGGRDAKSTTVDLTYADSSDHNIRVNNSTGFVGFVSSCDTYRDPFGFGGIRNTEYPPEGYRNVLVQYRGGYETTPTDIDQTVREMIQSLYNLGVVNTAVTSESLGDYSYTLSNAVNETGLTQQQWERIAPYISPVVA